MLGCCRRQRGGGRRSGLTVHFLSFRANYLEAASAGCCVAHRLAGVGCFYSYTAPAANRSIAVLSWLLHNSVARECVRVGS